MTSHNKRGKATKAANKERKAERNNPKSRFGYGSGKGCSRATRHGGGGNGGYMTAANGQGSAETADRPRRRHRTFDEADPLDQQLFDYIVVVDVEATCEDGQRNYPHEVIEIPGILIDVRKGLVDRKRSFHTYVKPWRNPQLSEFCTTLTGITQEQVDTAPDISEAIRLFAQWWCDTIPPGAKAVFAADGPWDFKQFLYEHHVLRDHVALPTIFYEYLDIRTTFARVFNHGAPIKLEAMLHRMGLRFEGRPHNGFDDAYNIARLAVAMMKAGCIFDFLLAIPLKDDTFHYDLEGYPLYRRAEGSGGVDPDTVDDIAKACYGDAFFTFGERHRAETLAYRAAYPHLFKNHNAVLLKRKGERVLKKRQQRLLVRVLYAVLLGLLLAAVGLFTYHRQVAAERSGATAP